MEIWKLVVIIIGVVLVSVGVFGLAQPSQQTVKQAYANYSQTIHVNVVDNLKPNLLYGNESYLINPKIIYQNITTTINASITISINNIVDIGTINYYVYTQLSSANPLWNKTVYTMYGSLSNVTNTIYTFTVPLNITANITTANMIDKQLNQQQISSVFITVNAYAQSKLGIANTNVSFMVIGHTYTLRGPYSNSIAGTYYKYVTIGHMPIIALNNDIFYTMIGAGFIIILAGTILSMPKTDELQKFKKDYAEHIIQVDFMPSQDAKKVGNYKDLLKLANYAEHPVFMNKNIIFTEINGIYYYTVINYENK
jgi:hypothetical protein